MLTRQLDSTAQPGKQWHGHTSWNIVYYHFQLIVLLIILLKLEVTVMVTVTVSRAKHAQFPGFDIVKPAYTCVGIMFCLKHMTRCVHVCMHVHVSFFITYTHEYANVHHVHKMQVLLGTNL
jgi:hypothetical protein